MSEFVFVYGSLKRGFGNNRVMPSGTRFIKPEITKHGKYTMYSYGAFPAVKDDGECYIQGELYEVPYLDTLDRLEGNGSFYQRELVEIEDFDKPVWMYMLLNEPPKQFTRVRVVDKIAIWENYIS